MNLNGKVLAVVAASMFLLVGTAHAGLITGTVTDSVPANDYFPASRASDGGCTGSGDAWVTQNPNYWSAPEGISDYFGYSGDPIPVLTIDLGADKTLNGFALWQYCGSGNSVSEFNLQFATAAAGTSGFGAPTGYTATMYPTSGGAPAEQDFTLGSNVTARYVQMTITDNYYGSAAGGDRVGLTEIEFSTAIPEPTAMALLATGLLSLLAYAWRRRR